MNHKIRCALAGIAAPLLLALSTFELQAAWPIDRLENRLPGFCGHIDLRIYNRAFCDLLHDAALLPRVCFRSPGACIRFVGTCFRNDLSEPHQRACDRLRFGGEPHYIIARVHPNGGLQSYHLRRTDTGEEVLTAYPYGIARAIPTEGTREVRMRYEHLQRFWRGRPVPGASFRAHPVQPANLDSSGFAASGLALGWNDSTGQSTSECIEFTLETPTEGLVQTAFSSQDQATSTAEQINISATVNGAFSGFSASDSFSYSDQYKASANSGFEYFDLANIYGLNTAATGDFTDQGTAAINDASFDTICGSEYLTSVQGGFYATISIDWSSSSSSTSTSISDEFTVSDELDSLTSAVTVSESSSESEEEFSISLISYGGGIPAPRETKPPSTYLSDALATEDSDGEPYYQLCAGTTENPPAPSSEACNQFSGAMATGAENASAAFTNWVNSLGPGDSVAAFELFPSGVAGFNPGIETLPMPTPANDILAVLEGPLKQYMDVLNQLATLENRADYLANALENGQYNPVDTELGGPDLQNLLEDEIKTNYGNARVAIINALKTCLNAKSDSVCQAVNENSDNSVLTAYDWYQSNPVGDPGSQQLLLQNTIALQYAGSFTNNNSSVWPQDVVYVQQLPSWSEVNDFFLIGNQAALVGFADSAYVNNGTTEQSASVAFLPLNPTADLADVTTEVFATCGTQPPGLWYGWLGSEPAPGTNDINQPMEWKGSTESCHPTADNPCEIWYGMQDGAVDFPLSFLMKRIDDLFPATGN